MVMDCAACTMRVFRRSYIPYFTVLLSTALVSLFYSNGVSDMGDAFALTVPLSRNTTKWWQFFSVNLVHSDELHLWSNVLALMTVGLVLEVFQGSLTTLVIFTVGGTTGVFAFAAYESDQTSFVGASAGIYALVAAYGAHLILNWRETWLKRVWAFAFVAFVATEIAIAANRMSDVTATTAYLSHIGGLLQGFVVGLVCVKNKIVRCWEVVLGVCACFVSVIIVLSLLIHIEMTYDQ